MTEALDALRLRDFAAFLSLERAWGVHQSERHSSDTEVDRGTALLEYLRTEAISDARRRGVYALYKELGLGRSYSLSDYPMRTARQLTEHLRKRGLLRHPKTKEEKRSQIRDTRRLAVKLGIPMKTDKPGRRKDSS